MHPWRYSLLALSSLLVSVPTTVMAVDITKPLIQGPIVAGPSLKAVGTTTPTPYGGMEAKGWVMLNAPVNADVQVGLSPSNTALIEYPFTPGVKVPAGQTVGNFTFRPKPVTGPTSLVVTARIGTQEPKTINYTILPPVILSMTLSAMNVVSGNSVQGAATFSGPPAATGTIWANLSSGNFAVATVPPKATLELGKTVAPFEIKTSGVANDTSVTIKGSMGSTYPTTAALNPYATLKVLPASWKEFRGSGCETPCTAQLLVSLTGAPPPQGAVIHLSSSNPARASVPASVTASSPSSIETTTDPYRWAFNVVTMSLATSTTDVTISATYRGETKQKSLRSFAFIKPDLSIHAVSLKDRFGNPISSLQDSQPFKICMAVWGNQPGDKSYHAPPPSLLRVEYRQPTSGGTSTGRASDISVAFTSFRVIDGKDVWYTEPCADILGLSQGAYYDVTLQADVKNQVDERNEGNNSKTLRISR